MASSNAGPITGSELIRATQGQNVVYLSRPQVASLLAFTAIVSPRSRGRLSTVTGSTMFRALQGGQRIEMNAAEFTAYLAGSGAPEPTPGNRVPQLFTGEERITVRQGEDVVDLDLQQLLYVRGLGGSQDGVSSGVTPTPTPTPVLTKLAAGIARVKAATGRAILAHLGDSITAGWGSGVTNGAGTGQSAEANFRRGNSWPHQLGDLLNTAGIPTRADAFFPSAQVSSLIGAIAAANPNMTFGSGWDISTGATSLGGALLHFEGATIGVATYTPEVAANSFDFLVTGSAGIGSFTVSDSDGTLGTIDETVRTGTGVIVVGSTAFRKVTLTRAVASLKPITMTPTSSTQIFIAGIIPYDTTSPRLELLNMGWPGATTSNWLEATSGWNAYAALQIFNGYADAFTLELGANDANASVAAATYQTRLQQIATRIAAYGDVMLVKPHKTYTTPNGYNISADYLTAIDAVQASVSTISAVNFNALTISQTGYYDPVHLSSSGYALEASTVRAAIQSGAGA